ncbi:MBOAT family O-acyltransferase [Rosistilla oblonga]|uniref:MBOAT family O-acyltransferase n=1 Tax=Rosistilla oblonga TaxID=2527990 RepID=UPI003A98282A
MIFNSATFLLFLAIVLALYYGIPARARLAMLFSASLIFYGFWQWNYVWLMIYSVVLDYTCAIMIDRSNNERTRKLWLAVSLVGNLGMLFFFKYLLFAIGNAESMFELIGVDLSLPHPEIVLPLGISFYTFQTMSYSIDVYRRFIRAERNPILLGTYVTFFPQLVAGPILRATEVMPQLVTRPAFDWNNIIYGGQRVLNGLFLKVVLADNIAEFVDDGFGQSLSSLSALDAWTLTFLFGFQIYFDFSAYSHIALGSARMMGIVFPENFNFPYFSQSPRDFWKRWHISLSSWIRDYLYLPLTGAKVQDRSVGGLPTGKLKAQGGHQSKQRSTTMALFVTWAIMGMWHGANWTFLYWGLFHATWIYVYRASLPALDRLPGILRQLGAWPVTIALAMASWIPFRADSVSDALTLHGKMLTPTAYTYMGMRENTYVVAAMVLIAMCLVYASRKWLTVSVLKRAPAYIAIASIVWGVQLALVFIFLRPVKQFIYFQF